MLFVVVGDTIEEKLPGARGGGGCDMVVEVMHLVMQGVSHYLWKKLSFFQN